MKLRCLHLSDLQLRHSLEEGDGSPALSMLDTIKDLIAQEKTIDLIFITGDLAFSGKPGEYHWAETFCNRLLEVTGLPHQRLFIVPGNHDIDRRAVTDVDIRRMYSFKSQDDITKVLTDTFYLPTLLRKFSAFNAFSQRAMARSLFDENKYQFSETVEVEKQGQQLKVNIVGLNSALFAGSDEDNQQKLAIGTYQVENTLNALDPDALFSIALVHHPLSCLHPADEASKELLMKQADLVLTGHTHNAAAAVNNGAPGNAPVISTVTEFKTETPNSFNLVEIDLIGRAVNVQFYKYLPQHKRWKKNTDVNPDSGDGSFHFDFQAKSKKALLSPGQKAFYLSHIRLENIQGFESLSTGFSSEEGNPLMFTLLLGDNSTGKSSFLRCLALGVCDEVNAVALMTDVDGKWIRHGQTVGIIEVDLKAPGEVDYRISTRITRENGSERVKKEYYFILPDGKLEPVPAGTFPWKDLFICGYGAGRVLGEMTEQQDKYSTRTAVETLFSSGQPMQHPELSLRRVASEARNSAPAQKQHEAEQEMLSRFLKLIKNLFMFTGRERIELTGRGIEVVDADGRSRLQDQGDGYKSTSAWVVDLVTMNMLAGRELAPNMMSGIVLVDEIEQHLHPRWARYIIQLLNREFPGIQFIASTHSPLCTAGITDLDDDCYQVLRCHKAPGEPANLVSVTSLRGLRADQVLTSEAFDLPTTRNPATAKKLDRFGDLYLKESRTPLEEQEFRELGELLKESLPESAEDVETRLMQQRLNNMIKDIEQLTASQKKTHD